MNLILNILFYLWCKSPWVPFGAWRNWNFVNKYMCGWGMGWSDQVNFLKNMTQPGWPHQYHTIFLIDHNSSSLGSVMNFSNPCSTPFGWIEIRTGRRCHDAWDGRVYAALLIHRCGSHCTAFFPKKPSTFLSFSLPFPSWAWKESSGDRKNRTIFYSKAIISVGLIYGSGC